MKSHRAIWTIAATAAALALVAFAARQVAGGLRTQASEKIERDRLVAEMILRLDRDHRARFAATRAIVEKVAAYCDTPTLECSESWYARGLRMLYGDFDMKSAEAAFRRSSDLRPEWAWPVNGL